LPILCHLGNFNDFGDILAIGGGEGLIYPLVPPLVVDERKENSAKLFFV